MRFTRPVAYEPEENRTYDVSQNSHIVCPQLDYDLDPHDSDYKFYGQEDCLVLNIYVPEKVYNSPELKATVMVFIHGGGLGVGCGNYGMLNFFY